MKQEETLQKIGLIIKKYRLIAGLSQESLSELADCDKNTIGRIERGETDFKFSILLRITKCLNLSFSKLANDFDSVSEETYAASSEYNFLRLFQYCHELSPEQINNLCNTASIYLKSNHN